MQAGDPDAAPDAAIIFAQHVDDNTGIHVDDNDDGGYETSSMATSTTSLTSSCNSHTFEHGRRYHAHPDHEESPYPLPNDRREQEREDLKHDMMLEVLSDKLFLAPVDKPLKVLDIGTGTGQWAIAGENKDDFILAKSLSNPL